MSARASTRSPRICSGATKPSVPTQPPGGAHERAQVAALDVAHRDVQGALVLARVVDRDDVRVVDRRRQARLADEALTESRVLGELRGDELEGDRTVEVELDGPVDDAHAAATGDAGDAVAGEDVACSEVAHDLLLY